MAMILEENTMLIAFWDWQREKKLQRIRQRQTYMSHKCNMVLGNPMRIKIMIIVTRKRGNVSIRAVSSGIQSRVHKPDCVTKCTAAVCCHCVTETVCVCAVKAATWSRLCSVLWFTQLLVTLICHSAKSRSPADGNWTQKELSHFTVKAGNDCNTERKSSVYLVSEVCWPS